MKLSSLRPPFPLSIDNYLLLLTCLPLFFLNLFLILSIHLQTATLMKIAKLLDDPLFWRILGFGSSIVALVCFALSPSFQELFGRWNLFRSAIYSVISLSLITMMLFVKKCRRFTGSVLVKAHVGFLVLMLTSLCSLWQDLVSQNQNQEKGSRGRILNMCSFGAFGLMSLSLSRQLQLGFEVGISNFLFGSFLVLLMKMDFKLAPLAAILCYVLIHIRSFTDCLKEMRWRVTVDSSDTALLADIESGGNHSVDLQPMIDVAEQCTHKKTLKEYAEKSHIPIPIYQAVNVGLAHAPQFRSAVSVDKKSYTSENVFPKKKSAQQDVAKLAFKLLTTGVKDEGLSLILERPTSFMSILDEYANKMNLEFRYHDPQEVLDGFLSSLIFDGKSYVGDPKKNIQEAEQSAACTAVLSNLERLTRA